MRPTQVLPGVEKSYETGVSAGDPADPEYLLDCILELGSRITRLEALSAGKAVTEVPKTGLGELIEKLMLESRKDELCRLSSEERAEAASEMSELAYEMAGTVLDQIGIAAAKNKREDGR